MGLGSMKHARTLAALSIGGAMLLTGCASVNRVETADTDESNITARQVSRDSSLSRDVSIRSVRGSIVDGRMMGQLIVRNNGRSRREFRYNVLWFNADGMQIDRGASTWTYDHLVSGETKTLQRIAQSPGATDFVFQIHGVD
ncbi:MAG: DUF1425 domain-containing protein [Phycisphaerales bacterium]|nr:MAG: DUF1425 domain-containing protein [Phycisphaerales bacterium]